MTAYTLTTGNDDFPGSAGPDTFSGPGGGTDALNGAGGDDTFTIHGVNPGVDSGQRGTIDGGAGTDTVVVVESTTFGLSSLLTFSNVEILDLTNLSHFWADAAQVEAFSTILVDGALPQFSLSLSGPTIILPGEGTLDLFTLDLSKLFDTSTLLKVSAGSAGRLIGTDNADELHGGSTVDYTNAPPPHAPIEYGSGLEGGGGNDRLFGSNVGDGLHGGADDDYLEGGGGNDGLSGDDGSDQLFGGWGSDTLDGGAGADYMQGDGGGDLFVVDNLGDLVVAGPEAGGKYNGIAGWISIDLRDTTHYQGVIRNVLLLEGGNLNATGNALDNSLRGNSGNNVLNGGAGKDTLEGGLGDDTYRVDNAGDRVVELKSGGNDTVLTAVNYRLTGSEVIERLWAVDTTSTSAVSLYGNNVPNHLRGNAGKNILDGGAAGDVLSGLGGNDTLFGQQGNDVLAGGQGDDVFVFNTSRHPTANVDRIMDFANAAGNNDYFALDDAFFGRLPLGVLAANRFHTGASAHDLDDRVIYNRTSGDVFFDADGNKAGGLAAVKFAHLDNHAALTNADFILF